MKSNFLAAILIAVMPLQSCNKSYVNPPPKSIEGVNVAELSLLAGISETTTSPYRIGTTAILQRHKKRLEINMGFTTKKVYQVVPVDQPFSATHLLPGPNGETNMQKIRTVAFVVWDLIPIATYTNGDGAFEYLGDIKIVDIDSGLVTATNTIRSKNKASSSKRDGSGDQVPLLIPIDDALDWIESIPVKVVGAP